MTNPFFFSGQEIHRLNLVSSQNTLYVQVGGYVFKYNLEQLALLSPLAVSHFQYTPEPFRFDLDTETANSLVSYFVQLDLLFHTNTELILTHQNVNAFSLIADALDNFF
jgi:hypothetical protein